MTNRENSNESLDRNPPLKNLPPVTIFFEMGEFGIFSGRMPHMSLAFLRGHYISPSWMTMSATMSVATTRGQATDARNKDALRGVMPPVVSKMPCDADLFKLCHATRGARAECVKLGVMQRCAGDWARASELHLARREVARCRAAFGAAIASDIHNLQTWGHLQGQPAEIVIHWEGGMVCNIVSPTIRGMRVTGAASISILDVSTLGLDFFDGEAEGVSHWHTGRVDGPDISQALCRYFNTRRQQYTSNIMERFILVDVRDSGRSNMRGNMLNLDDGAMGAATGALARAVLAAPETEFEPMEFDA